MIVVEGGQAPAAPNRGSLVERRIERPGGRTIAWAEAGLPGGAPVLRIPGTPASRLAIRPDDLWTERGLHMVVTERPGFGASTQQFDRRFADHADDLAAILDALAIDRVPVHATSGGAPYGLALAARHPDRVAALTVVVGVVPIDDDEAAGLIGLNAAGHRLARAGDRVGMTQLLSPTRAAMLDDPLAGFRRVMASAPTSDQMIMNDAGWQAMMEQSILESLRQGVEGWVDESMLMFGSWADIDPARVMTSVSWWHGDTDRNVPISSVRRFVERLPTARLSVWSGSGHLTPYLREGEILDELLARAANARA